MTPTEPAANPASTPKAGLLAALRGLLGVEGIGAPSYSDSPACRPIFLVVLPTALCALLLSATPALAANGHALTNSFGSETSTVKDAEPLSAPTSIAWSAKTNEIYVIDAGHDRVVRFSSGGTPEGVFEAPAGGFSAPNAIAVDNSCGEHSPVLTEVTVPTCKAFDPSYGDVYVSDPGNDAIDKYEPEGKYTGFQLTEATTGVTLAELRGVAVDPSGTLWVYDNGGGGVYEFAEAATNKFTLPLHEELEQGTEASGIAIDSEENLYLVNSYSQHAMKWAPGRSYVSQTENCECATGVAVEPGTNNVYVDQRTSIGKYEPFGEPRETPPVETFGMGVLQGGTGSAVSATGTVYVADSTANDVDVFEEGPKPTRPITAAAQLVEGVSATLNGKLEGGETSYRFAYNTNGTCEGTGTHTTPTTAATSSENVSVMVTGLTAQTKYTYCLIDENKYGQETGVAEPFNTTPSAPVIEKTSSSVNRVTVALSAGVNPELEASTCVFQYGTSESYGHETPCEPGTLGEGETGVTVKGSIKGLEPATTYDYRVLATNGTGHQAGPNETFTTEVITPTEVETAQATNVTPSSAVIGGQVNPQGGATYYIEYGVPTCSLNGVSNFAWWLCATETTEAGPLTGDTLLNVTPIQVTGLTPGTTYSYWIVAHNKNGSERGEEAMFTTPAALAPAVVGSTSTPPASTVVPAPKPAAVKPPPKRKTAAQEKAEKLRRALKQCRKLRSKARRKACEAQAHRRYGPKPSLSPSPTREAIDHA